MVRNIQNNIIVSFFSQMTAFSLKSNIRHFNNIRLHNTFFMVEESDGKLIMHCVLLSETFKATNTK